MNTDTELFIPPFSRSSSVATELLVEEVNDVGYYRRKDLDTLFHGIVGHVRDLPH